MKSHHSDGNGLQALCVGRSPLSAVSKGCPVEFLEPCPPSLHGCVLGDTTGRLQHDALSTA